MNGEEKDTNKQPKRITTGFKQPKRGKLHFTPFEEVDDEEDDNKKCTFL